ncbi:heparin lyase I family protein [Pedobacter sp.]|uniref:heparin lyase I family protein n=1 Tax=Pedobacter sp. TaxID=1411316 RepID=UPI0031E19020
MEMKSFIYLAIAGIITCTACGKSSQPNASPEPRTPSNPSSQTGTIGNSDTILNVTYETGALNGGYPDIIPTKATASDAASLINPGRSGNYAIAHKVTLGNPDYYSNEAYRSEADALNINDALFFPGQERRYEFSLYLKDWEQWNAANPPYGDNIFQLKVSGGDPVPVRLLTKRHAIVVRYDASGNAIVIPDFRPQINKWIDFRIDVKWTLDNTGYFKIYTKYQGEQDFTLRVQNVNARTFTGTQLSNGQKGYIKWGVYREAGEDSNGNVILTDNVLTRVAYHDNIRIIKLN